MDDGVTPTDFVNAAEARVTAARPHVLLGKEAQFEEAAERYLASVRRVADGLRMAAAMLG